MFRFIRTRKQSAAQSRPTFRKARIELELLDIRVVPSTTNVFINDQNQLQIDGTDNADNVVVTPLGTDVQVNYNGELVSFNKTLFSEIVFNGNAGNDFFANFTNISVIGDGGTGDDRLISGRGDDNLLGGDGNDVIKGGGGDDVLDGGADVDRVDGGGGNDDMSGGTGNDDLKGKGGDDILDGDEDNDILRGGRGRDDVIGGDGDDDCRGGGDDDYLEGGTGSDDLRGGQGDDSCSSDDEDGTSNENELRAILRSAGDIEGEAEFELENGTAKKFKVEIEDAVPNQSYSVHLDDGTAVATITTDAEGDGRVVITSPTFAVTEGTVITVKDAGGNVVLEGTFRPGLEDDNGNDDGNQGETFQLRANLTGDNGADGEAEYEIEDGSAKKFKVEIEDVAANTTFSVFLDGGSSAIASLTTDARGDARVTMLNPSFTITEGMTLQVKNANGDLILEGTFQKVLED